MVEVTLAIGVLAFAFMSIFGLLSTSMNLARDSMSRTHHSRITQRLVARMQQIPFANQSDLVGTIYRFDGDGEFLGTGPTGEFVYTATILDQTGARASNESQRGIPSDTTRVFAVRIAQNWLVTASNIPPDKVVQFSFATADMAL